VTRAPSSTTTVISPRRTLKRLQGVPTLLLAVVLTATCGGRPGDPDGPTAGELDTSVFGPSVRGQIDEALAAAEASPADPEAQGDLGRVLHAYELYEPAAAAYGRAIAADPEVFRWHYLRGKALASAGRQDEALVALEEALAIRSDYPPLQVAIGKLLFDAGDSEAAYGYYLDALRQDPLSTPASHGLAKILAGRGDTEAAVEAYRATLELAPDFGAAHYALGILYRDLGESAKAAEHLALAEENLTRRVAGRDVLMSSVSSLAVGAGNLTTMAVRLRSEGRTEEAIARLLEAVKRDPDFLPARVNLVKLFSDAGRYDEAEEHYRAAIAVSPNAQQARFNYARSLVQQQRVEEALAELRAVVAINPHLADAQVLLGSVLDDRGQPRAAQAHYREALASKPFHPQANLMMAIHGIRDGDFEAAEGHARRLQGAQTESLPILVYRLALSYSEAGRPAEAAQYFAEARRMAQAAGRERLVAEIDSRQGATN